jgi:hypothetical protein
MLTLSRPCPLDGMEKVTLELLKGACHADPAFETPNNIKKVLDFLGKYLKK